MKKLIGVMLLLVAGSAHASAVIIDFEGLTGEFLPSPLDIAEGFRFETDLFFSFAEGDPGNTILVAVGDGPTSMNRIDGTLFDLNSLDIFYCSGDGLFCQGLDVVITAFDSQDQIIAQQTELYAGIIGLRTVTFDSSWINIRRLTVTPSNLGDFDSLLIDNINVNVIPIPAAVYLFGSALAGLGWMRRKKTV